ncbi:MAG TPA: sulfatase-like hydrolase/transferase [Pirellulales bacterium]|nr:sulfatase-like hydrolase/transferase [Pirellulales bacterium]
MLRLLTTMAAGRNRPLPGRPPRITTLACCVAGAVVLQLTPARLLGAERTERPNVVVIMADDQGSIDAGCYGAEDLATPAIDALARRGVRLTQFYSAAPVCSPSRAGLLTGRYPLRAGLPDNAGSQRGEHGMPGEQVTIAEMLKADGYATAHVGKWHLGYTPDMMPNRQGFGHSFGHMGGCIDNYSHFFYWSGPNVHDLYRNGREVHYPGRFFGDLMVEEATRFIEQHREHPFFLYFALNMPHYPYQGDPKWLEHYKDLPYPRNLYAAFVSTFDERVGALVKKVDDFGLREKTLIVYQSDNGHSTEERAHFGGGSAGIYRGAKFSLFEGGMRSPAIISWPGHLPEGEVRDQLAHSCDWMPTIAELTGAELLNEDIDGLSIVRVVRSATAPSPHKVLHWHVGGGQNAQWATREGDWKLIGNVQDTSGRPLSDEDKKLFLSNLATDVSETRNLANDHPDVVARLKKRHDDWFTAQQAPLKQRPSQDTKGNEQ